MAKQKPKRKLQITDQGISVPKANVSHLLKRVSDSAPARCQPGVLKCARNEGRWGGRGTYSFLLGDPIYVDPGAVEKLSVVPILPGLPWWLGIFLDFEEAFGQSYLTSVNLKVYFGDALQPKRLLLRAEWDFRKGGEHEHAQPHWHLTPEVMEGGPDMHRFHMAMCARWDGRKAELGVTPTEEQELMSWLRGCWDYIHGQFLYIAKHAGAGAV